ncbi:MAG TPA: DUF1653 domain-containing protein [Candidatus Limnocylindria bacterium]|jgi:hypothetical protein|nr:DUF1653 domain-containing protein [Candidatus Limnocylindria bacterium]
MENAVSVPPVPSCPCGVYRHYKGNYYLVLGLARHSETDEMMVVYVRLYSRDGVPMSVRPLDHFLSPATVNGSSVVRFQFIGQQQQGSGAPD